MRSTLLLGAGFILGIGASVFFYQSQPVTEASKPNGTAKQPTGNQPLIPAKTGITDKEALRNALLERAAGNYILELDIPGVAKRVAEMDKKRIAEIIRLHGPLYKKTFAELGISTAQSEQLLNHIGLLYQAKLDATSVLTQLMNAQADYDNRMKGLLGQKYDEYRRFEDAGKARNESNLIEEFAKKSSLPGISPEKAASLIDIIQSNKAYSEATTQDMSGAFDEPGKPLRGNAVVRQRLEQDQATLVVNAAAALQKANETGFTADEIGLLEKYYASQSNYYESELAKINDPNPLGSHIQRLEEQYNKMRVDPKTTPSDLKKVEKILQQFRAAAAHTP